MDGDEVRKGREEEEDAGRAGLLCQRSRKKVLLLREKMRKARELLEVDGVKKVSQHHVRTSGGRGERLQSFGEAICPLT